MLHQIAPNDPEPPKMKRMRNGVSQEEAALRKPSQES